MHSTYISSFGFNEEWYGKKVKFAKKKRKFEGIA
jgi:hypothetical protein